jgi:beta-glucosidase
MGEFDKDLVFPEDFLWGTAASAHQIEGDNTKNQWWRWEQTGSHIADGSHSGRARRHFELFEKDLDLVEILGLSCHRFSVEWSRIEPEPGVLDEEAIDHYRAVLKGLRERELAGFVTLHHFTVPQWFEDAGGWLNPEAPDRFAAFARRIADKLGENINYYITINEPMVVANASYLVGAHPPGHTSEEEFAKAAVNLLCSHAKAARAIRESAGFAADAKIGIAKSLTSYEAVDPNNAADIEEKEKRHKLLNQWFLDSLAAGRALEPLGTGEPIPGLPDSCDFIGVNYYLRARVSPDHDRMRQYYESMRGRTEQSDLGWEVYPEGIRQAAELAWELRKPIFITANGIADHADHKRAKYIVSHLAELHGAIQAGVDVQGYMHWTLLDDFEWALGFVPKFGLATVGPGSYKRIPRKSAVVYKEIATANKVPASLLRRFLAPQPPPPIAEAAPEPAPAPEPPPEKPAPQPQPETRQPEVTESPVQAEPAPQAPSAPQPQQPAQPEAPPIPPQPQPPAPEPLYQTPPPAPEPPHEPPPPTTQPEPPRTW